MEINNKQLNTFLPMKSHRIWSFHPRTSFDQKQNGFDPTSDTDHSHLTGAATPARKTAKRAGATRRRDGGLFESGENDILATPMVDGDCKHGVAKVGTRGAEEKWETKGTARAQSRR